MEYESTHILTSLFEFLKAAAAMLSTPQGQAMCVCRCIVSASSGKGVFDGNVKVERLAQQTDAAQLSRNILLSPKGTLCPQNVFSVT